VSTRTYPPAPGWSPDGHRIKAPPEYGRGPEKAWAYGALRVRDGKALTLTAPMRNTKGYLQLLEAVAEANPAGDLYLITDNLLSHKSPPIREWLEKPPRVKQVFIPVGACWLKACRKHGDGCFGVRPWQDRASPMRRRLCWPRGLPQNNSTSGRNRGFGVVYRSPDGTGGVPLYTVFEERSDSLDFYAPITTDPGDKITYVTNILT
jgi:DDE superfamily endonuclease